MEEEEDLGQGLLPLLLLPYLHTCMHSLPLPPYLYLPYLPYLPPTFCTAHCTAPHLPTCHLHACCSFCMPYLALPFPHTCTPCTPPHTPAFCLHLHTHTLLHCTHTLHLTCLHLPCMPYLTTHLHPHLPHLHTFALPPPCPHPLPPYLGEERHLQADIPITR